MGLYDNNEKDYVIDLKRVFELCFSSENADKREQEITDGYEIEHGTNNLIPMTKMVREIKSKNNGNYDNLRYDLVKTMILVLFNSKNEILSFGEDLCMKTLINEKIIVEV